MIWSAGAILPDDALTIPASDRTFEHGLGLFETLRTRDGRPTLLDAHRARMLGSAADLGLGIDPASLPDESAVDQLLRAEGIAGDRLLRITASGGGGVDGSTPSVVWMRAGPLPSPPVRAGARVLVGAWEVARGDRMARHKSLNYWGRRLAFEEARGGDYDESLGQVDGVLCEGSRSNLFVVLDGVIRTPSTRLPIVPGVMRALVLAVASASAIPARETGGIEPGALLAADEAFLTNSVRGIIPIGLARRSGTASERAWVAPGPWTRALQAALAGRLARGETNR